MRNGEGTTRLMLPQAATFRHWGPCVWPLFLVFDLSLILRWSFANRLKYFRILRFGNLLPEPDHLDLEAPLVAIVEEELHLDAKCRERLIYRGSLNAPGFCGSLNAPGFATAFQVGKE